MTNKGKLRQWLERTAIVSSDGKVDGSVVLNLVLLFLLLAQQICNAFGVELPIHQDQVVGVLGTILTIGVMLGVVYDYNGNQGGPKNGNKN
ncbi:hypothetical protein M3M39_04840 [Fructilactobacillus hinvesii]|uniref:Holin n=1 Tax=Fructilactobacillus hinvesii TaxID=2940300 RepID=A0ABY5BR64_9LACO|nr:hypothetical protein [Fructilactobacillus hinvesii]USS87450.1 hypothetical protein M3M39_04840 [Fructilactobacillus hinvesii]